MRLYNKKLKKKKKKKKTEKSEKNNIRKAEMLLGCCDTDCRLSGIYNTHTMENTHTHSAEEQLELFWLQHQEFYSLMDKSRLNLIARRI